MEFTSRGGEFEVEGLGVDDGRGGVEGHVDEGGDPARRRRASARVETLPRLAAGFVEVDVDVHQPGGDDEVGVVDHLRRGERGGEGERRCSFGP